VYGTGYPPDYTRLDSLARVIAPHAKRLAASERAIYQYMQCRLQDDFDCMLQASQDLMQATPGSAEIPTLVAATAVYARRPFTALRALERTDPTRGLLLVNPTYWRWRTAALHQLGQYQEELEAARRGRAQFPGAPELEAAETRALAALGRTRELMPVVQTPTRVGAARRYQRGYLTYVGYIELDAHGFAGDAGPLADSLLVVAGEYRRDTTATAHANRVGILYTLGRLAEADSLLRLHPNVDGDPGYWGYLGAIALRREDSSRARAYADSIAGSPLRGGRPYYWLGRLQAIVGDVDSAVLLLRRAERAGYSPWRDGGPLHEEPDFAGIRQSPAFQELLRPRDAPEP
jgi:tetratricopeptide (TPR) repeat protein